MLAEQVTIFGWSIVVGMVIGFLFDLFRGLRWEGIRDIWVYLQDMVFWIVTAIMIIISSFLLNRGELRGYMLLGYVMGAGFYMLLFSKIILKFLKLVNGGIRKGMNRMIHWITQIPQKRKNMKIKQEN